MSARESLLPPGYPRYGQAVDRAAAKLLEIPIPIRDLWNPWACPESHIPYLAWALSVDVWNPTWPLLKKRSVIASSIRLHRIKGTLGAIRGYQEILGNRVLGAVVPPAKMFAGATLSRDQREAALDVLPQIRLFDYVDRGKAGGRIFLVGRGRFLTFDIAAFGGHPARPDARAPRPPGEPAYPNLLRPRLFPLPSTAPRRIEPRAILWDRGVTTVLKRAPAIYGVTGALEQVLFPGVRKFSAFVGRPLGTRHWRHLVESTAASRIYNMNVLDVLPANREVHRSAMTASIEPLNTYPDTRADRGHSRYGTFAGRPLGRALLPSTAKQRLYKVIYVRDDRRIPTGAKPVAWCGISRLGIPPYWAEVRIAIKGKRSRLVFGDFVGGYLCAASQAPLRQSLRAVVAAKAVRDKVLIKTKTARALEIGQSLFVGDDLILGVMTRG